MKVALSFICLCFLLLQGKGVVYAAKLSCSASSLHYRSVQQAQPAVATVSKKCTAINNAGTDDQNTYFTGNEAEDEDLDELFARKFNWLARSYSTLSFPSDLIYPFNRSKAAPSFCGRISYRYILQRVLRV